MARPSTAASRNLSLTEELEKLEQSITLTLQEIDSNFAKAHSVVTGSILPIVERYARNSEAVWDGSKFWKQFFEASANVSLSNYAEPAIDDSSVNHDTEHSQTEGETETPQSLYTSPSRALDDDEEDITITTPGPSRKHVSEDEDDPLLTSPSIPHNHSTPRMPGSATGKRKQRLQDDTLTKVADAPSPYEKLRREMRGDKGPSHSNAPTTPGKRPPALPDMSMTSGSSPFDMPPESAFKTASNKDAILHQGILGRTYRVAATPMTARRTQILDTAMSSPDEPEPQLRPEIFSSPLKPGYTVQTPGRKEAVERQRMERRRSSKGAAQRDTRELDFGEATRGRSGFTARSMLDWESDDEDIPEMSPPKTIHFGMGGNPLIQTPAREASRQIVEDLLFSAGGDINNEREEYSPSVIMKGHQFQDDTF